MNCAANPQLKLYALECRECGNACGYSFTKPTTPDRLCCDCAQNFVCAAKHLGREVFDSANVVLTTNGIVEAKWHNHSHYEFWTRTNLKQWRVQNAVDVAKRKQIAQLK